MRIIAGLRSSGLLFSTLGLNAGDPFIVTAGTTVIQDISTPALGSSTINGTFLVRDNLTWDTTQIVVDGGSVSAQNGVTLNNYTLNLTGAYVPLTMTTINSFSTPTNPGNSRGIMVMNSGSWNLTGFAPTVLWTTLNANASAGASSFTLAVNPGWLSGDQVVMAPTDFPEYGGVTELLTLSANTSSAAMSTNETLVNGRYGLMQYPVDASYGTNGMSNTPGTFSVYKATASVPTSLDQRARVANLRRGILVKCPNDTDYSVKGHGVHFMAMTGCTVYFEGFQVLRGGQAGAIGRYPIHSHMMSWNAGTGGFLGNASFIIRKGVVNGSKNRAFTCHGTNGSEWSDNIAYDITGHAFFQEDGSEGDNTFQRNSMFKVRSPNYADPGGNYYNVDLNLRGQSMPGSLGSISGDGTTTTVNWTSHGLYSGSVITVSSASIAGYNVFRQTVIVINANQFTYLSSGTGTPTGMVWRFANDQIKAHDAFSGGYWITNLGNIWLNNYASDCVSGSLGYSGFGSNSAWISVTGAPTGLSHLVAVNPLTTNVQTLQGFTGHSVTDRGLRFADGVGDEVGNPGTASSGKYSPAAGSFASTDHVFWKCAGGAYKNSVRVPDYQRWTTSDNAEGDFFGSTDNGGQLHDSLGIGLSLNSTHAQPSSAFYPRAWFTPYHGTVRIYDNTCVNFPFAKIINNGSGNDRGEGGGVSQGSTDSYDTQGVDITVGLNTNIKLLNSDYGDVATPVHLDGRSVDVTGQMRHYSLAGVYLDATGKYGTAGKFVLPFARQSDGTYLAVDDYLLSGAASVVDGPTFGTVCCKTTTTRYFGLGWSDSMSILSDTTDLYRTDLGLPTGSATPLTITRQNSAGVTIGTPWLIKDGATSSQLNNFRAFPVQAGGYFSIAFTDGTVTVNPPTSIITLRLAHGNVLGDFVMLGIPWANASVPRVCMGNGFTGESSTFANAADITANRAIIATSGASKAAAAADTTGTTFWRDTTNNTVWVRWTARAANGAAFPSTSFNSSFPTVDIQFIVIKV